MVGIHILCLTQTENFMNDASMIALSGGLEWCSLFSGLDCCVACVRNEMQRSDRTKTYAPSGVMEDPCVLNELKGSLLCYNLNVPTYDCFYERINSVMCN
jgi:hypothetical protein